MTTSHMSTTTDTTHAVLSQDGAKISYFTMGSGPSVLVIPGALSMAADYAAFASALAEHFTVHIIERRGRVILPRFDGVGKRGIYYSIKGEQDHLL